MTTQNQLLLKKLQGIYDRAIATDIPRVFFPVLYEFVQVYDKTPALEPVWKSLVLKGDEDTKKLKALEEQAHKDMQETYEKITKHIAKNKIAIPAITEHLERYRAFVENRATSSNGQIEGKHGALAYVIMCLAQNKEADYIDFAQQFGEIQDDGYIENWTFAPSYKLWKEEKEVIERLQRTEAWHSWDRIAFFFKIYKDYEKLKKEQVAKQQWLSVIELTMLFEELNELTNYKEDRKWYLKTFFVGAYKVHLERIFSYTQEFLASENTVTETTETLSYNSDKAKLTANGKSLSFKKESFRAQLLALLTKNSKNIKRKWSWDEIYEKIEATEPTDNAAKKYKRKLYYTCEGINSYIFHKTGLNDFLDYDTNHVQINPLLATKL